MARTKMNKRQLDIYLMVGALIFLIVLVPFAIYMANAWNGMLSSTYKWEQQENETGQQN